MRRRLQFALGAAFVALVLGALWWTSRLGEREFMVLASAGRDALQGHVVAEPSAGRGHDPSVRHYDDRFPTSGVHNPTWTDPGIYTERQSKAKLVHALEHGNIVIYYDDPPARVLERLRGWASLYDDPWSGIVLTPAPGLGEALVLTAWTRRLTLEQFQPELAAAFIDAYRGRGPEKPVR